MTVKGVVWGTSKNPTVNSYTGKTNDGSGTGSFVSNLTGLLSGQIYYVRAYATNSMGTAYGASKIFAPLMVPPGKSFVFDGNDDYVQIMQGDNLPVYNSDADSVYSIAMWVKGSAQNGSCIYSESHHCDSIPLFMIGIGSSDKVQIFIRDDEQDILLSALSTISVVDGNWHHIVWVDSIGIASLYIDGLEDGTNFNYSRDTLTLNQVGIGAALNGPPSSFFQGEIDELRVWKTVRSQSEIQYDMHHSINATDTNLVAYYRFNSISGIVLIDYTGNENNGTISNMRLNHLNSTAPVPYFTANNGNWENNSIWATGQNAPTHPWSRVKIKHNNTLNSNMELIEMVIDTNAIMTISTGDTLTVVGQ